MSRLRVCVCVCILLRSEFAARFYDVGMSGRGADLHAREQLAMRAPHVNLVDSLVRHIQARGAKDANPMNVLCELVYGESADGEREPTAAEPGSPTPSELFASPPGSAVAVDTIGALFDSATLLRVGDFRLLSGRSLNVEGCSVISSADGGTVTVSPRGVHISSG
jgi:hypothetical protein